MYINEQNILLKCIKYEKKSNRIFMKMPKNSNPKTRN